MATPKHLLIIEDALDIQLLLKKFFQMEGYQVDCASNGKEALDHLQQTTTLPQLILLDLMMPIMDGFEFRDRQRQVERIAEIPVVIMTADGDVAGKKSRIGAIGILRKPIDIDELLRTVESATATVQ